MSRRRRAQQREIAPDPKFGSAELAKFINRLMMGGKKSVARRAMYDAIDRLESETNRPGLGGVPTGNSQRHADPGS